MSVTEVYMAPGSFSVALGITTPQLMDTIARGGYLVITNQRLGDPRGYTDAGLLAAARYTGIVTYTEWADGVLSLEGSGLDWVLGDLDGVGWPIPARSYSGDSIATVCALIASGGIIPPEFSIGSIITGGSFSGSWSDSEVTCKAALMQVMDAIGNHYRIGTDGKFQTEVVTANNLYRATPKVVLVRDNHGADALWISVPVRHLASSKSIRGWLSSASTIGGLGATPLTRVDTGSSSITRSIPGGELQLREIEIDWNSIEGYAAVGDTIYAWDPGSGYAGDAIIQHRGEWINPAAMRIHEATWPITEGMGVYYRPAGDVDTTAWVELTDTFAFDAADTTTYLRAAYVTLNPCA